jgi:hypothetical protein
MRIPTAALTYETSRYNWAKEKAKKKEEEPAEDEDSSSFLRMIMD